MADDRLARYRDASKRQDDGVFFNWLSSNCVHARPIHEVRKLLKDIKEPIREESKDDTC